MHIACDLDGTLAHYDHWRGIAHIGEPIEPVLLRVKQALANGHEVTIFTARVSFGDDAADATGYIEDWCEKHIGQVLPVTAIKRGDFDEFWDDRAVGITKNTGRARAAQSDSAWRLLGLGLP